MAISDNVLILLLVLISVSTCGNPDVWDGAVTYLMKQERLESTTTNHKED